MPQPVSAPAPGTSSGHGIPTYTVADLGRLTARAGLAPAQRGRIQAAASVLGFRVTSYVADELIDWSAAPDDPLYRLVVPGVDMPGVAGAGQAAGSRSPGGARRPGEQVLPGVHRSYQDTVSVFAPPGPAGCFGTVCPGRDWPAPGPGPVMAAGDGPQLAGYLAAHPEVSVVEFTGADPLTVDTPALRCFIEPLLTARHLVSVRLRTAALACWPYRFTAGPDADELLRLFEQVCVGGKSLELIADLSHPRELEPEPAREAVRRIRGTGAVIYADGTLADTVNDAPGVWRRCGGPRSGWA
jgi:L-lysine 2,3-aminomutase